MSDGPAPEATTDELSLGVDVTATVARVWRAIIHPIQFGWWFGFLTDWPLAVGEYINGPSNDGYHDGLWWDFDVVAMEYEKSVTFFRQPFAFDPSKQPKRRATFVELSLSAPGAGTSLSVNESGFDGFPRRSRDKIYDANAKDWARRLERIKLLVDG